jgi:hypothetical protein
MVSYNSIISDELYYLFQGMALKVEKKFKEFKKKIKLVYWNENNLTDKILEYQLLK